MNNRIINLCEWNWAYNDDIITSFYGKSFKIIPKTYANGNIKTTFTLFETPSEYLIPPTNLNSLSDVIDYNYTLEGVMLWTNISINYNKFDTDILQQFINFVLYHRGAWVINRISTPESKTPTSYKLINEINDKTEVIITFPYENIREFTIEII